MTISPNSRTNPIGRVAEAPFRVLGNVNCRSFGDYVSSLFFINSIAKLFDHSRVTLIYKNDCGFKKKLTLLLPDATVFPVPANGTLPSLEILNPLADRAALTDLKPWFDLGLEHQDFVVTETMNWVPALSSFEHPGHLSIPADHVDALAAELTSHGADPKRWLCCIHYREAGYKYKPVGPNFRDSDPLNYLALTNHIIETLGGQVVRLGHPEMTPFPARKGFIDLSRIDDNELLQAFAISRSRFVIAGPSGASAVATSLNVPLGQTDAVDFWGGVHAHDVLRTIDVITPNGERLNQLALWDAGLGKLELMHKIRSGEPYQVIKNSPKILAQMADHLYEATSGVSTWREPTPPPSYQRPNCLVWPRSPVARFQFLAV